MYPSSYKSRQDRNIDTDGWSQPAWLTLEDVLSTLWWGWKLDWLEVMTLAEPDPTPSLTIIREQWGLSLTRDERNFRSNISISDSENPQFDDAAGFMSASSYLGFYTGGEQSQLRVVLRVFSPRYAWYAHNCYFLSQNTRNRHKALRNCSYKFKENV